MCGIIGYIGKNNPNDILINGLYNLEYRGYDSSGIAICDNKNIEIIKSIGRVSNLEEKIKKESRLNASYGIAHTRWATNGEASLKNAHPHKVGRVTIVHNGIIENADILKENLIKKGYTFNSETDSEVVAALLDSYLKELDVLVAINKLTKSLVGSYAIGIIIDNYNGIYAIRKDSPLILGIGLNEYFLASDITAIIKYTNKYILLDEGEIAFLTYNDYKIYKNKKIITKEILIADNIDTVNEKKDYSHYMLKEIMEEPIVLQKLIKKYSNSINQEKLNLSDYKEIDIVACGSAMYAGFIGQNLFEEYANIKTNVYPASEYRYKNKIYNDNTLVILISQSGETADTIAAMREVKRLGLPTLAIVNNKDSTIAREADIKILTEAGVEVAVATTKAYILQVSVLALMAYITACKKNLLKESINYNDFEKVPILLKEVIENNNQYKNIAEELYKDERCFYIGRGIDYAMCMEASLKLKEVSYIHSEAYQAGELKHGSISLIEKNTKIISIITDKKLKEKTISNIKEVEARGAKVIIVTTKDLDEFEDHLKIVVPTTNKFMNSILVIATLQLLAYYVALKRNCDIDKPRNLAKSVTVE